MRQQQRNIIFAILVSATAGLGVQLYGCSGRRSESHAPPPSMQTAAKTAKMNAKKQAVDGLMNSESGKDQSPPPTDIQRMVIYNASLRVVVEDYQKAASELEEMVKSAKGFIAKRDLAKREGAYTTYTITLRIPAKGFRSAMQQIAALGYLEQESTSSEDITEQYYDIQARLRNAEKAEQQLLEILSKKASNLTEYLAVQREITRVREEIERHKGRIRVWDNLVAFSTIRLTLVERKQFTPPAEPTYGSRLSEGFMGSLSALFGFAKALVLVAVVLVPWLLALAVVLVPLILFLRRRKRNRAQAQAEKAHSATEPPAN